MALLNDLLGRMDDLIAEFQIDSNGLIEKNFRITGDSRIRLLQNYLVSMVPDSLAHYEYPAETISYHPADGLTYVNDTIVVVYVIDPPEEIIEQYGIPRDGNFLKKGFAIKYDLTTGRSVCKLCNLNYKMFENDTPTFPWLTQIGYSFGIGQHFSKDPNWCPQRYIDFYVANPSRILMRWHYKDLYPEYKEDFWAKNRAYAVCYDLIERKVVKLKRYIYWNDKELKHLDQA